MQLHQDDHTDQWRRVLGAIVDRERALLSDLSDELGVNPVTITRWMNGTVSPRNEKRTLLNILHAKAFPREYQSIFVDAIQELYPDFKAEPEGLLPEEPAKPIESAIYSRFLQSYAQTAEPLAAWTPLRLALQLIPRHLDPEDSNEVTESLFLPIVPQETEGLIRSFCLSPELAFQQRALFRTPVPLFFGTESVLGRVASYNKPLVYEREEIEAEGFSLPSQVGSLLLYPLQRRGLLHGCLLLTANKRGYFNRSRLMVISDYGILMSFAFYDHEFYPLKRFALGCFPALEEQIRHHQRTRWDRRLLALRWQHPTVAQYQLEQLALLQLESELLCQQEGDLDHDGDKQDRRE